MVLIQALLSFIGRSAGKVLNAIFGWAVIALFGRTSPRQQTLLSGLVAMAVLWPLILVGIVVPKVVTFLIAFVPLARSVPDSVVRIIWIALALLIPLVIGIAVAAKAPHGTEQEPVVKRLLRGFPLTIALAAAFLVMFVTVPMLRIVSIFRGWSDEHVPLITEGDAYRGATERIEHLIEANGLDARRAEPPWWMRVPTGILRGLGGRALRGVMPEELSHWRGANLQVALYPSDVLVRGDKHKASWTHGLIAEAFARGPGYQTFDPDAQEIERQVQRIWSVYEKEPDAHRRSHFLLGRVREAARELSTLDVPYEQWEVVYRKLTQLARAIDGERQLLQDAVLAEGGIMEANDAAPEPRPLESASMGELLGQFFRQSSDLLHKEMELAKAEVGDSVKSAVTMTIGFATAAVFGLLGLGLLSAAAVLALATTMAPWGAALLVGVVMLVVAGILAMVARSKRVKHPLKETQRTLKEDVQWAKERMA